MASIPFHVLIGEEVEGGCVLSWASTLAEGWGSERKQARGQKEGSFPALGLGHTWVTLQCLFNLLRKFLNLCDLCTTNELWAINDGFKASRLGFVNYGWRGGSRETQWEQANGLGEDFTGRPLRKMRTQAQEGSEGRVEGRTEECVRAGSWTTGMN